VREVRFEVQTDGALVQAVREAKRPASDLLEHP